MATTVTTTDPTLTDASSGVDATFVADRQAFWNSFTRFVFMGTVGVAVLLFLMLIFLV